MTECQVSVVVMITRLVEGKKKKADKYWPDQGEEMAFLNGVKVSFFKIPIIC